MKYYRVTYNTETTETTKPLDTPRRELYYDVNGNICFSSTVYEVTHEVDVIAHSAAAIQLKYPNILSIDFLSEKESHFDALIKKDYTKQQGQPKIRNKKILKSIDCPCTEEVQLSYQKHGDKWFTLSRELDY